MTAIMTIDQDTLAPAGVAGFARTDGLLGAQLVTLESVGVFTTFRFELLWVPTADTTASASLAFAGGFTFTFSPTIAVPGEYRIKLITDEGTPQADVQIRVFVIRTPNLSLAIPSLNSIGDPSADLVKASNAILLGELIGNTEQNEPYGPFATGSFSGWQRYVEEFLLALDALVVGAIGLQTSYDTGNTITQTPGRPIAFDNPVDATDLLTLSRTFAAGGRALRINLGLGGEATTGPGLSVFGGAGNTGNLLELIATGGGTYTVLSTGAILHSNGDYSWLANGRTFLVDDVVGGAVQFSQAGVGTIELRTTDGDLLINTVGTGDLNFATAGGNRFQVTGSGAVNITPFAGRDLDILISGGGDFEVDVSGAGDITLEQSGTGNVLLDAAGGEVRLSHLGGITRALGDFVVDGTTFTVDSETVLIADNYLDLNAGYTTAAAQTGGFNVNRLPIATTDTVNAAYVAGVAAVSNPFVGTVGAATFAVGELIQFSAAADNKNEGIYEVLTHAGNVLTVRGVGLTGTVEAFTQNQFEAVASNGAAITRLNESVLQANLAGTAFEVAFGSTTPLSFEELLTASSVTLQIAADGGNTIDVETSGPISIVNSLSASNLLELQGIFAGAGQALTIAMGPAGQAATGHAISIVMGSATIGEGVLLAPVNGALGTSLALNHPAGTSASFANWTLGPDTIVDIDENGLIAFQGAADQDVSLLSAGTGTVALGALGSGGVIIQAVTSGNVEIDAVAGEFTMDDVGDWGGSLSQTGDRVLVETGGGEVLDGVTSLIAALNRLAEAAETIEDFSQGVDTTSGSIPLTKVSIVIPAVDATFIIIGTALVSHSNTTGHDNVRLFNTTDTVLLGAREWEAEQEDTADNISPSLRHEFVQTAAAGAKTIALQYFVGTGSGTLGISDAMITAKRLF